MKHKINFKPAKDGVLVHIPKVTESGIVLPNQLENKLTQDICELIAVGPDCKVAKEGDIVSFISYCVPQKVILGDEEYLCLKEYDILGYYEPTMKLKA